MEPIIINIIIGMIGLVSGIVYKAYDFGKNDALYKAFEARVEERHLSNQDKLGTILDEIKALRASKHDLSGVVMRHDSAIKDLDLRVSRLEKNHES